MEKNSSTVIKKMRNYNQWYDLGCELHKKNLVMIEPGKWFCEGFNECGVYDFNNLTYCKGYKKDCNIKIVAQNYDFPTKEDLYCEDCIKAYELDKETTPPAKIKVRHCKEKDCSGIVERHGNMHVCTTCGVIEESEKEQNRIHRINRMNMIHSKGDLPSKRR